MDLAYDHIAEEALPQDEEGRDHSNSNAGQSNTLNADFQAAYTALSATASPWASRIGGFFGSVVKQVCSTPPHLFFSFPVCHHTS